MKLCKHCQIQLNNSGNIFCSKSCAAKFNNPHKLKSAESRAKTSSALKGRVFLERRKRDKRTCIICSSEFEVWPCKTTKCCSRLCGGKLSFQNKTKASGRCLSISYFCKETNKEVFLQSNWEVEIAKYLDNVGEVWIRPDPINWQDSNNRSRKYYPDFYLPRIAVYLDPKNGQVMKSDAEKIEKVSKLINLIVGTPQQIISELVKIHGHPHELQRSERDRDLFKFYPD